MKKQFPEDRFLSEWIQGAMSDEELRENVSHADYEAYLLLREQLSGLSFPEPDLESSYRAVKAKKIAQLDAKPRTARRFRWFAVAALVVVCLGIYRFAVPNVIVADLGTTTPMTLSDGSRATLNSGATITYPNFFSYRRSLELDGEAFFDVRKGRTFTVRTTMGKVTVLGTQFNVIARPDYFEVVCYQGKVRVARGSFSQILTPGRALRFYKGKAESYLHKSSNPGWVRGQSSFQSAPLEVVIDQLEKRYERQIIYPDSIAAVRFTGSFTHNDLQTALKTVATPLRMQFTIAPDRKITLSE